MITVDIKIDDGLTKVLKGMQKELTKYPQDAEAKFKSLTPIDTGNARRHTKLVGNRIEANYQYAQPLDNGHSKQAPQGMVKPFSKWMKDKSRKIFGK